MGTCKCDQCKAAESYTPPPPNSIYPVPKFIRRFEEAVEKRWMDRWDRQGVERVDRHFRAVRLDPVAMRREFNERYGPRSR